MGPGRDLYFDKIILLAIAVAATVIVVTAIRQSIPTLPDAIRLKPATFSVLAGWAEDDQSAALAAFQRSCARWSRAPDNRPLLPGSGLGSAADWRTVCEEASKLVTASHSATAKSPDKSAEVRRFFETHFAPVAVLNNAQHEGLFTAYFQIEVAAGRSPRDQYSVPLYRRPGDLVQVNLGLFRDEYTGRSIAGRVDRGRLVPFAKRAEIDDGALAEQDLEIAWIDNPVDAFFLQIQGSGRLKMPDGSVIPVGFDGSNGHPYTTLGGLMLERGLLPPGTGSMAQIRDWIADHPAEGAALMAENARYIFFRERDLDEPLGAQEVPLIPGRSLAVDLKYLPLGVPLWLETTVPAVGGGTPVRFQRLMVAQDTGSAITGPVRGDIYWGTGPEAGAVAGRMKYPGRYYVLLPKAIAAHLTDDPS